MQAHRQRLGFTLLEVAIVIAVMAIVAAVAVPSYGQLLARQQLRGAGESLALQLRSAREEAVQSGRKVFVSSAGSGADWCWGVNRDRPCNCASGVPACALGESGVKDYPLVELARADALEFQPGLGRVESAGLIELKSRRGHSLQLRVNAQGRTRICGPDAPKPLPC